VIVRFAGQPIGNATALLDAVRSQAPGSRVGVTFLRGGVQHSVTLALGSALSLIEPSLALTPGHGLHAGRPDGLHWRQRTLPG
jgi:hypothetical protein